MSDGSGHAPLERSTRWHPSLAATIAWTVAVVASVLSVMLRAGMPFTIGGGAVDDLLYLRTATYLARGQWLGPFDQYTLVKGPAYPAFVAAMYRSGVPLQVGEQLTHLLAAAAIAICVWVVARRAVIALAVYVALALDPVNFDTWASRATRDGWYASLTLLLVATVFLAVYAAVAHARLRLVIAASVIAGVSAGVFTLCREETMWIAPTLLVVALGLPLCVVVRWWFRTPRTPMRGRRVLRGVGRLALVAVLIGVVGGAAVLRVTMTNERQYGAAVTSDLVYGSFGRAYADWRRVAGGVSSPDDPITQVQREAVYAVSPLAWSLQPYLDPSEGCVTPPGAGFGFDSGIPPCARPVWRGLRDAAAILGYFRTADDAQRFFAALDGEIQAGCDSGELECTPRLPTQLQSLQLFSSGPFFDFMRDWGAKTATSTGYYDLPPGRRSGLGTPEARTVMAQVIRGIPATLPEAEDQARIFASNDWPYRFLFHLYAPLLPCLLVLGLVGSLLPIVRPRWPQAALSVLSIGLVIGAATRLALVALLTITQFGTRNLEVRYLLPAHALLLAFAIVGTGQLADAVWTGLGSRRAGGRAAVTPEAAAPEAVQVAD
jgi:hypothetical protein